MLPTIELERIADLFKGNILLGFILVALLNSTLMVVISMRFFESMQQCGYKGRDYLKWLFKRDNAHLTRLCMLSLMSVLGFILINMAFSFLNGAYVKYLGFIAYFLFLIIYFKGESKRKSRVPLVITKRMIRLIIVFVVLAFVLSLLLIYGVNLIAIPFKENLLAEFRYAVLCLVPISVPYLVLTAYGITKPLEKSINKKHIIKCKQTLLEKDGLIKIAITGSYGKTSVKEILYTLLSSKYNVLATPESYNTPMGIAKTVKRLDDTHDIFICEMGARRQGEIKELCETVLPNYAVITGITAQHLESFLTLENVIKTKSEILGDYFKGTAFISGDNKHTLKIFEKAVCEKYLAGAENKNGLVYAENVIMNENGTTFTMVYGTQKTVVSIPLLGMSNVHNVCLASAVALKIGLSLQEVAIALTRLKQIPHRLSLSVSPSGVNIIDDGYNSNPEGVKYAIDALSRFSGKKYIVTPGLVELGFAEAGYNFKLGESLATVCDGVILVGRSGSLHIREGLLSKDYPLDKIFMVKNLEEAKAVIAEKLMSGDVVLFENDLPDILS
ncbi:MAG: UDP-N-acetylmuramoyl-tripeptide--D-alanyl-D-alanine ligase [Clostridia bacterium]|nr:UDP-N-acetylmuramoyl-tripeptide--D-alanyl-D-alanine ligase [Clostridia bacterium]